MSMLLACFVYNFQSIRNIVIMKYLLSTLYVLTGCGHEAYEWEPMFQLVKGVLWRYNWSQRCIEREGCLYKSTVSQSQRKVRVVTADLITERDTDCNPQLWLSECRHRHANFCHVHNWLLIKAQTSNKYLVNFNCYDRAWDWLINVKGHQIQRQPVGNNCKLLLHH